MKTNFYYALCFIILMSACQKIEVSEMTESSDTESCIDKFDQLNNRMETAPLLLFLEQSEWLSLIKNDNDYWRIVVKANAKGGAPTKIAYEISNIATIDIAVFRQDTLVRPPQTTMTFRHNIRETIDIPDMKIGDTLTVQMRHKTPSPTCYALSFQ